MPKPKGVRRVLIVNPFGVGDVIFTMPLVEALRREKPRAFIGFVCNERTVDLVRMNTAIDKTYVFNRERYRKLWKKHPFLFYRKLKAFLDLLKAERFQRVMDLSLGREYGFFAMIAGILERVGFDYKGRGTFLTRKIKLEGYIDKPVAEIQLALLSLISMKVPAEPLRLSLKVPPATVTGVAVFLKKNGFLESDKILAIAPGGGRSWGADAVYKQWDPEHFASAVETFCRARHTKALLLGDRTEKDLLEEVKRLMKIPSLVVADAGLDEVAALLLRSTALLCNDGGLLHLANALGVKTVSIFGPVDEKVYGPYGGTASRTVLTRDVPCRPCYQKFHFPPCPYERRCLSELPVETVVEALENII